MRGALIGWWIVTASMAYAADVPQSPRIAWNNPFAVRPDRGLLTAPPAAVARIIVPNSDSIAYGSGTLIDVREQAGLVITNWHVVDGATGEITVQFPDGFRSGAKVLKADKDWDLAALAIWRPKCAPLTLATAAPQPGEPLTIGGYGSGQFRLAAGQCIQYGAPSTHHPAEIVEVSAEARQGDSGGPILNQRGEVAGVLFGTGGGVTSGSYCGRVRTFLATVMPGDTGVPNTQVAAQPNPGGRSRQIVTGFPAPISQPNGTPGGPAATATMAAVANNAQRPAPGGYPAASAASNAPSTMSAAPSFNPTSTYDSFAPRGATNVPSNSPTPEITWDQIVGKTPVEQGKTLLAGVGLLFALGSVVRWLRG